VNSHFVRTAGLCALSGVMATLSLASLASVASAAPAGGGVQPVTSQPDVVSAAITDQPSITNPAGTPRVKVCFDSPIAGPVAANFAVSGTDVTGTGNPLAPASAASIPAELNCASLTFAAGSNLAGFSTLEAQAGAVSPAGGGVGGNPQGAVALTGGDITPGAGRIAGPNLAGAAVAGVAGGTEVTYTFDTLITQAGLVVGAPAGSFGYYDAGVARRTGTVASVGDKSVKIMFPAAVAATARVFVDNNAVTLAGQTDQGNVATAASGSGTAPPATSSPDIVSVTRVTSLQGTFDIVYDQNITSTDVLAANCQADTPGSSFAGTAVAVQNATTVRVTFGGLASSSRADEEIVRVTDTGGCVVDISATPSPSTVGAAPIQNKDHTPGFTTGPDLTGCAAPAGTDVTYAFDELLTTGAFPAGGFGVIDANGARVTGAILQVLDNRVTVRYSSAGAVSAAAACTVDRAGITDRQPGTSEPSSMNTVKVNSVGTPENAGASAPVVTPPATKPGPATPFVRRAARSLGISVKCQRSGSRVRCTTRGTLKLATALAPLGRKLICTGSIRVRFTAGSKTLSSRTSKLRNTCTYKTTVTFRATTRQRSRLRVQAKYLGSAVSLTKSSKKIRAKVRR
jgi:hypothetical protein